MNQPRRALAHPLRSRIVAHLRIDGAATSADLARALETNSGVTSYHLRVLESVGLVEDTGLGNAKTRLWAVVDDHEDDDDLPPADADDLATDRWLDHDYVDHFTARAHRWIDEQENYPSIWQESCGLRDVGVLATEEQFVAYLAELDELNQRYRRIGAGSPGARRVAVFLAPLPVDPPT
ncbi:winged helix-turn-helix domain-containing protein [Calidifontibacter terrae]